MRTSLEIGGRAGEISRWDREFNGLLTLFANLDEEQRAQILMYVKRAREKVGGDTEGLIQEMRALAEFYGLVSDDLPEGEGGQKDRADVLTARIGEFKTAVEALDTIH